MTHVSYSAVSQRTASNRNVTVVIIVVRSPVATAMVRAAAMAFGAQVPQETVLNGHLKVGRTLSGYTFQQQSTLRQASRIPT